MDPTIELSAAMRRSSPAAVNRILFLLYALDSRNLGEAAASETGSSEIANGALSAASLCLILRYAFPGRPTRLLYALSSGGSLFRSPDRGISWRFMYSKDPSAFNNAVAAFSAPSKTDDKALAEIMQLLPTDPATNDDDDGDGDDEVKLDTPSTISTMGGTSGVSGRKANQASVASCVACEGRVVAIGGGPNFLAVSGDGGVHFTQPPARLWDCIGGGDKATVSNVSFVDEETLLMAAATKVVAVRLRVAAATGSVSFGVSEVVLTCKGPICLLDVLPAGGCLRQVVVGEAGVLHFSWNAGRAFVTLPHKMGLIRSLSPFAGTRRVKALPFPAACKAVQAALAPDDATAAPPSQPSGGGGATTSVASGASYEYAAAVSLNKDTSPPEEQYPDLAHTLEQTFLCADRDKGVFYQHYLATGVGTEVLGYDFSCRLCVGMKVDGRGVATFSHATHVDYIPFCSSTLSEPVVCAVSSVQGSDQIVALRGNSSGFSVSTDCAASWSTPKSSAIASLLISDGGEVVVCAQRGTVTVMNAVAVEPVTSATIAGDFRSPTDIISVVSS